MRFNFFGRGNNQSNNNSSNEAANYETLRKLAANTLNDFETSEQALAQMAAETGQDIDDLRIMLSNLTSPYYGRED